MACGTGKTFTSLKIPEAVVPAGKFLFLISSIICSCEGNAEEAIIDLLLEHNKLCFNREDLVCGKCTQLRKGIDIAQEYLRQEFERGVAILRIQDREKDKFKLPRPYCSIPVIDVVTKPEIEILHIIAENCEQDFEHCKRLKKNLKPSEYCKGYFSKQNTARIKIVKSKEFVESMYANNIDKLIDAIRRYRGDKQEAYCLRDLLV